MIYNHRPCCGIFYLDSPLAFWGLTNQRRLLQKEMAFENLLQICPCGHLSWTDAAPGAARGSNTLGWRFEVEGVMLRHSRG